MSGQFWMDQLDLVEQQFDEVFALLLKGESSDFQTSAGRLQDLAINMKQLVDSVGRQQVKSPLFVVRLRKLSHALPSLREALLRRTAQVERALQIVVPVAAQSTYGTNGMYGNGLRQSGAFNVLSA